MSSKEDRGNRNRLSREILGLFGATALIAVFFYVFLNVTANSLILSYAEKNNIIFTELETANIDVWLEGVSFLSATVLFVVLFLFLVGERIAYVNEIVKGIDALGRHEWDYEIPLDGNNELTELAEQVNKLSKEEQAFREKEKQIQEEKESLIRGLSHDIRTPLTSILSYSEYMKSKADMSDMEVVDYIALMEQKAQQIKVLTDRLLEGGNRQVETIENGRFFMEQLVNEWEAELESEFHCQIDFSECPDFSGEFDVQELRRIFDNLASNIKKYADESAPIVMQVASKDGRVYI